jgi:KEOPS complex subunit Cgi121
MSEIFILEGTIEVKSIDDFLDKVPENCAITVINADWVADKNHVEFAAKKAFKAWIDGRNIAKTLPMEVLLYTAATRQIHKAIRIGLGKGENRVVMVIIGDRLCIEELKRRVGFKEENVLELTEEKIKRLIKFFEIEKEEIEIVGIEKLSLLLRERIVLFDISK